MNDAVFMGIGHGFQQMPEYQIGFLDPEFTLLLDQIRQQMAADHLEDDIGLLTLGSGIVNLYDSRMRQPRGQLCFPEQILFGLGEQVRCDIVRKSHHLDGNFPAECGIICGVDGSHRPFAQQ